MVEGRWVRRGAKLVAKEGNTISGLEAIAASGKYGSAVSCVNLQGECLQWKEKPDVCVA